MAVNPLSAWREKLGKLKGAEWAVLLILVGILGCLFLMDGIGLSTGNQQTTGLESRLEDVLSKIQGAGRVRVMVYDGLEEQTSGLFQAASTSQRPVGVVVVADGAEDIRVKLELTRAVQTLMNLPAEAVEVFRMTPESGKENGQ